MKRCNSTEQVAVRLIVLSVVAFAATTAQAQNDRVRTNRGTESGKITEITRLGITVQRGSTTKQVPVSEIVSVQFAGEPSELTQARVNARNGGYRAALEKLGRVDFGDVDNPYVKQEVLFYMIFCRAKLALAGSEDVKVVGGDLNNFAKKNPQSYHFLRATELLGDLLAATGRYGPAERMYQELAKAPFPSYKARAGVLVGRSLQQQDKHAEAIGQFDAALAAADDTPEGKTQRLAAQLGKAVSMSATGQVDQGVGLVEQVLRDADPTQNELLALAYNALGGCYVQAGKTKDALFAFLHVDLLFATEPEAHAEALFHLSTLWEEIGKPQQAREARQTLQSRYASSSWAKK